MGKSFAFWSAGGGTRFFAIFAKIEVVF